MNLKPWTDHNEADQEEAGFKEGLIHCKQGWCTDSSADGSGIDTPFIRGYRRGWDEAKSAGLHGTELIHPRASAPHELTPEELQDLRDWLPSQEQAEEYFSQFPVTEGEDGHAS